MDEGNTVAAEAAHEEYLAETRRLIDEQVGALAALLGAAARAVPAAASRGGQLSVTRQDHSLSVTNGTRTATFEVEAITDLPEDANRAHAFPTSQARCTVRTPDGATDRWILHRASAGENVPSYTWMHADTERPVDEGEITQLLTSLFA